MRGMMGAALGLVSLSACPAFAQPAADPPALCASQGTLWNAIANSGDLVAMRTLRSQTPAACRQLLARMDARIAAGAIPTRPTTTATTSQRPITTTTIAPAEGAFERRDRIEREVTASGVIGRWTDPTTNFVANCRETYRGSNRTITIVGDQLTVGPEDGRGYRIFVVTHVVGTTIEATESGGDKPARIQVIGANLTIDVIGQSYRTTLARCP